jgi:hypothetical protein
MTLAKSPKPQLSLFDPVTGMALKHDALEKFELKARPWLTQARNMARWIAQMQGTVTSDDVLQAIGYPPTTLSWNVIGAIFKKSEWQICGFVPSKRVSAHGRRIGVWQRRKI